MTIYSLLVLSFIGDFDPDNFPEPIDKFYLILYLLVTVVVQLNILIAIVDSYARGDGEGDALPRAQRPHHGDVGIASWFPRCVRPTIDDGVDQARLRPRFCEAGTGTTWSGSLDTPANPRRGQGMCSAPSRPQRKDREAERALRPALLQDEARIREVVVLHGSAGNVHADAAPARRRRRAPRRVRFHA